MNNKAINSHTSFYLEAGSGLSLPTGKYNSDLILAENLPENFNIGNGSLGYILQMNAVLSHKQSGLLINSNYQWNSNTKKGYHFGNQFSSQLSGFREFPIGKLTLIPNLGLMYEHISSNAYKNGNTVPETGAEGLFISSAMNFKTNKYLICSVDYQLYLEGKKKRSRQRKKEVFSRCRDSPVTSTLGK